MTELDFIVSLTLNKFELLKQANGGFSGISVYKNVTQSWTYALHVILTQKSMTWWSPAAFLSYKDLAKNSMQPSIPVKWHHATVTLYDITTMLEADVMLWLGGTCLSHASCNGILVLRARCRPTDQPGPSWTIKVSFSKTESSRHVSLEHYLPHLLSAAYNSVLSFLSVALLKFPYILLAFLPVAIKLFPSWCHLLPHLWLWLGIRCMDFTFLVGKW